MNAAHTRLLDALAERARASGVFDRIETDGDRLKCHALHVEEEAWYQVGPVETNDGTPRLWVGLYTPDRWLSESVEADVLHQGDKFEDLLEEELVDQGLDVSLVVEHFRDEAKVFVFRSPIGPAEGSSFDQPASIERVGAVLLAYEACFRDLGDMPGEEADEGP